MSTISDPEAVVSVRVRWMTVPEQRPTELPLDLLDEYEREKRGSLRFEADRRAYSAAHALLKCALQEGNDLSGYRLNYDQSGKLNIICSAGIRSISLSHTRKLVAVAIANDGLIGVDVETHSEAQRIEEAAEIAFAQAELLPLAGKASGEPRQHCLLATWTLKEAILKATGQGLSVDPKGFAVGIDPPRLLSRGPDGSCPSCWHLTSIAVEGGRLAVALQATADAQMRLDLKETGLQELLLSSAQL